MSRSVFTDHYDVTGRLTNHPFIYIKYYLFIVCPWRTVPWCVLKGQYLLPRDLQVEFNGPQVVDIHSHHLRHGSKQLLGLTDHTSHQHVSGQTLQLCHLMRPETTSTHCLCLENVSIWVPLTLNALRQEVCWLLMKCCCRCHFEYGPIHSVLSSSATDEMCL